VKKGLPSRRHPRRLGLGQHDLAHQDGPGVARVTPRQVPPVLRGPVEKGPLAPRQSGTVLSSGHSHASSP
jgi:hypothetical protein